MENLPLWLLFIPLFTFGLFPLKLVIGVLEETNT